MTDQTTAFVPPAAENLPPGVLDSATDGASALDAGAREPAGRNFLAHALVRLARDGWLRTEPGEGFEVVRDRETPEPSPVGQAPATDRAAEVAKHVARAIFALKVPSPDGSQHYQSGWDDGLEAAMDAARDAVLSVLPAPTDRAAVLREAADAIDAETRQAKADEVLEPDKYRPCRDASAQLRRMAVEAQQPETCGPAPDQCDAEAGEPCVNHEREQAHAEGEHCFCGPECDKACTCGVAGDCFVPLGHYADCPQATPPAVEAQQPREARL